MQHGSGLVEDEGAGVRLDRWLALHQQPAHSRALWQKWIREGCIRVDDQVRAPGYVLKAGQRIEVAVPVPEPEPVTLAPEPLPLDVLFEDEAIVVLNKAAGMVVHPAPGHAAGTLVNALLHHCGQLEGGHEDMRPGIVHRLDRDTSGVMVVAKTLEARQGLLDQFKGREVSKEYLALVRGCPEPSQGCIRTRMGRHPVDRKKMAADLTGGRDATTHYEILEKLGPCSLLRLRIETGRTHQIRVHMAHIGHGVLGDPLYGRAPRQWEHGVVPRQMLHAFRLSFEHPRSGERVCFEAPLPEDMLALVRRLREDDGGGQGGDG